MTDARPRHYGQYSILASVWPAPGNRYQSSFTVHKSQPGQGTQQLPQVYEERKEQGMVSETAAEAEHDAWERATFWIDGQPD